ncbi:hypothetical protein VKT23_008680 [Stygiomarasmius scandens]|uniref:Dihydrolipoamide acetyltransferase component of pyruvate dehydrogenase complex n=1 Tax=Marasmiellus scandens TaxID=2682957 RepID=A0ABR1JHR7_9AGAR
MLLTRFPSRALLFRRCFHSSSSLFAKSLQKFKLADIGEGITECEIIRWTAKPSSTISAFDPLCEVQSDKASVEITSPFDGVLKEILVKEGEIAKVGEGLCLIEVDEEAADAVENVEEAGKESENKAPSPSPAPAPTSSSKAEPERSKHPMDPTYVAPPKSTFSKPGQKQDNSDVLALPSVRFLARQHNVDLADITPGSGKNGRVEREDVLAFVQKKDGGASASSVDASTATAGNVVGGEDTMIGLGRTRYGMWKAMEKSLQVPHFSYSTSLDITELHGLLPTLNAYIPSHYLSSTSSSAPSKPLLVSPTAVFGDRASSESSSSPSSIPEEARYAKLTYLPFLLKTLSKAMLEWPVFRSSVSESSSGGKPSLAIRPHTDIALALSTPTGLYSPVLPSVEAESIYSLASRITHISYLGRQTPLAPAHFNGTSSPDGSARKGATLTVSNVGAIGHGESAHPVLVPGGGVAIVAVGRAKWQGVWERQDATPNVRLMLPISFSADHRVVEGAELAAFVECWREWVERPKRLVGLGI